MELAAAFLTTRERARLAGAERALRAALRRDLAAAVLQRGWRRLRQQAWMNRVINDVKGFHAFVTRLCINLSELQGFDGGLARLDFVRRRRRDVRLGSVRRCPLCLLRPVGAARYFSVGDKMRSSTPYLRFSCRDCDRCLDDHESVCYQGPISTRLLPGGGVLWRPSP